MNVRSRKMANCFSAPGFFWSDGGTSLTFTCCLFSGRRAFRYSSCHSCGDILRWSDTSPLLFSAFSSMMFSTISGFTLPHVGQALVSASA